MARFDDEAGWLVVERMPLVTAVNLGDGHREVAVPAGGRLALSSDARVKLRDGRDGRPGPACVLLPADSVAVVHYPPSGEDWTSHA